LITNSTSETVLADLIKHNITIALERVRIPDHASIRATYKALICVLDSNSYQ